MLQVCSVLQTMSERYFKRDGNEWLSGKIHFVKCIIEHVLKNGVEESLKSWLKGRQQDGFKVDYEFSFMSRILAQIVILVILYQYCFSG